MLALLHAQVFFSLADAEHIGRVFVRLATAAILGGLIGYEREEEHKSAGLRTHMLVALGAALFILVPQEAGASIEYLSRVVQGLTMGIGFLGGGVILKLTQERRVQGLTTAANLWVTAALGMAIGMGWLWPAVLAVGLAWVILLGLHYLEPKIPKKPEPENPNPSKV